MGQIIIMQDKIEIQVVETPDYSAQIDTIKRESEKKEKMDNLAIQATKVSCDDILEQMIMYVTMTMRPMIPILQYFQNFCAGYGCFSVRNTKDGFDFTISESGHRIALDIFDDTIKYIVDGRQSLTPYHLSRIIFDWDIFKEELNKACELKMRNATVSLRCRQEDDERYINNISNFKL